MITVTEKAKERIASLRTEEGRNEDHNIRVSVKGGGCSGLMYDLGFDDKINPADGIAPSVFILLLAIVKLYKFVKAVPLVFTRKRAPVPEAPPCVVAP